LEQILQHATFKRLRPTRRTPANLMVLLGDIGQIEELIEGAGHWQQLVLGQRIKGFRQLPGARLGAFTCTFRTLADTLDLVQKARPVLLANGLAEQVAELVYVLTQPCIDCRHLLAPSLYPRTAWQRTRGLQADTHGWASFKEHVKARSA